MSINNRKDKYIVVYSCDGILYNNENKQVTTTCDNMNEFHTCNINYNIQERVHTVRLPLHNGQKQEELINDDSSQDNC